MADNTTLNAGAGGDVIATDDIAGVKVQRVKVQYGVDGAATDVSDTNPMPIDDAGGSLTVDGTVTANLSATDNAVLDAIVAAQLPDGHNVTVDNASIAITAASLPLPSGAATSAAQLADGHSVALSATDNAVLDDIATKVASGAVVGGGVQATALRVTIASDSTGVLSVDDNGGSLTIDGTVTANLSATDNAVLDTIDAVLDTINAKMVTGTVIGVVELSATDNAVLDAIESSLNTIVAAQLPDGHNVTVDNASIAITAASLPLPSGAATSAAQLADGHTVALSATDNAVLDTIDAVLDTINAKLVTGTVIGDVNLGATDNAVLDDIAAQVTTLAAAVSTEMQVDVVGSLPAGTAAIGKLAANSGVDIGDVDVTSISAGSNLIGDVGISGARTSGGTTLYKNIDVDQTEDAIKASAGQLYWITAFNLTAAVLFLKIYNATTGSVSVGTTVPDLTFPIPTQAATVNGAGFVLAIPNGIAFSTAITIACTTGVADADSGSPAANACVVCAGYA